MRAGSINRALRSYSSRVRASCVHFSSPSTSSRTDVTYTLSEVEPFCSIGHGLLHDGGATGGAWGAKNPRSICPYPELETPFSASRDGPIFSSPPPPWWTFFHLPVFPFGPRLTTESSVFVPLRRLSLAGHLSGFSFQDRATRSTAAYYVRRTPSLADACGSILALMYAVKKNRPLDLDRAERALGCSGCS